MTGPVAWHEILVVGVSAGRPLTPGVVPAVLAVLDPALRAYDAYGLHHAADKPDREGHAISMMGAKEAQEAIQGLHKKFQVRGKAAHLHAWREVNAAGLLQPADT